MNRWSLVGMCGCLLFAWGALAVHAADDPAAAVPSAERIEQLIRQLDSDDFEARQQASAELAAAGAAAFEALARAARGDSLEVTSRALAILGKAAASDDETLRSAARKHLEQLAASDHPVASRRAKAILEPPQNEAPQAVPAFGGVQVQGIAIAIAGAQRVQVRIANGQKTIEVEEANRKVVIEESLQGAIKMKVTEKAGDKEKTTEYEARSADELKKNHPEAYKIYEQYSKMGGFGGGNIQIQAAPLPGALPMPLPIQPVQPAVPPRLRVLNPQAAQQLEEARDELNKAVEELRKLVEKDPAPGAVKQVLDKIEAARKKLDGALGDAQRLRPKLEIAPAPQQPD
jgi:hypothetical protein